MTTPPSSPSVAGGARRPRRWYAHGWNRPLSWRLILGVTPHLPRVVMRPLHHVVTSILFVAMPRERAAVRRNLRRVTGRSGVAGLRLAYRLFSNFGRCLVAYGEMAGAPADEFARRLEGRLEGAEQAEAALRSALAEGRGVILATMHVGHWDLGLKLMARFGVPVHVVMLSEDPVAVSRFADEARHIPGLTVHQVGASPLVAVQLVAALRRGEVVAIQLDRAAGSAVMPVEFFGAPADLPAGPAQLAMASGAPLIPIFVLLEPQGRYRLLALPAMRFERARGQEAAGAALGGAMRRLAGVMESVVAAHPDQWFNFYDVWSRRGDA